jgi:uncharacterized protein involved in outer membrane biogenesis
MASAANKKADSTVSRRMPQRRRWLGWIGGIILLLAVCVFAALEIVVHRAEPILKARVIDALSTRFDSRVELARFDVSVLRGLEVSGGGLKLYPNSIPTGRPLFAVDRFSFHTSWQNLLRSPMYIAQVRVSGLRIHLPSKSERGSVPHLGRSDRQHRIEIEIGEMQVQNAILTLGTDKPGKVPLQFDISRLQLTSIGAGRPMKFHALLTNPKPIGQIDSTGEFGPFQQESPGDTPVQGVYSFNHADLSTLKGIGGILSSTGNYQGTLNRIVVDGQTDTPDFRLDIANHPLPLHTTFHAIVDGINGDTYLQPVDALLLHSHIVATGEVVRVPGVQGHRIALDVTVDPAAIQDLLQLAVKTDPPLMTGSVRLHTSFLLPPGDVSVTEKLQLAGAFTITNVHFSNPKFQDDVDQLSLRSQGKAEQAKAIGDAKKQGNNVAFPVIASSMQGQFRFGNQQLTLSHLSYRIPGAEVAMDGVYSLDGRQFDMHGMVRTDAMASQMVTGWKSLLLKAVDPFLAKDGAGMEVPIQITGTRSDPHFGLDFHHQAQDKKVLQPNQAPQP